MDSSSATTKSSKPSSNISDIVYRFAKVCRLRSVGVFSNENPNHHNHNGCKNGGGGGLTEVSSDATTEGTECDDQKVHPQPIEEETLIKTHEDVAACAVLKLFDTISTLKLAYIQLQEAHIPYSPEKIQAADEVIVSELETLSDIKRSFKHISRPKSMSQSGPLLFDKLHDQQTKLEKLQFQIRAKDTEILKLKQDLEELDMRNLKLDSRIKQKSLEEENGSKHFVDSMPKTFSDAYKAATKSIHDFSKPLISLMKASGWDLDLAVKSIEDSVTYSKRSHKKYAFEAYLSRRMFHGFPFQPHNLDDILRFKDPFDSLIEYPDSSFGKFCRSKYLLVMHPKMENSFFGNLDQRAFVLSGGHPRTPLYEAFVKMAKCVWVLQAMPLSTNSKVEIFGVQRGSEFSEAYMENVVDDGDSKPKPIPNSEGRLRVGFVVMPGFRIGQNVIRSRVYLSKVNSSNVAC